MKESFLEKHYWLDPRYVFNTQGLKWALSNIFRDEGFFKGPPVIERDSSPYMPEDAPAEYAGTTRRCHGFRAVLEAHREELAGWWGDTGLSELARRMRRG